MNLYNKTLCIACLCISALPLHADEMVKVKTALLSDVAIYPQRTAPASVISLNATSMAAEIPARIVEIAVRVGDIVEEDQVLIRLKCIDYEIEQSGAEARLESINARIELAKRRLGRTQKLTMKQSVSEELLDERESELTVLLSDRTDARASLNLSRVRVASCVISSPFQALVTERTSAVGNYAEVGKTLVKILDIEHLEVSAQVYAQDVYQLKAAEHLLLEHDNNTYPLELRSILPSIDAETRNREVRLLFKNGPALAGASGKLLWRDKRPHIPGRLLVRRDGELGVFIYEMSKVHFKTLPGAMAGRVSPIDLALTAELVIEGHHALNDDSAVVKQ